MRGVVETWRRSVEPRDDGLPNARVVAVPLLILLVMFIGLVGAGITGSSTGMVHGQIAEGADSDLLAGQPRGIRSDEWFVQTSWVISQVEQGLPARNESFPGGMDATVQNDLPNSDWSTAFRPHLLGFFFLPLDNAMAFKWWLPGLAVIAAVYLFAVSLLPRRPILSSTLAAGFFFSPFFQWWYLSLTLYPAVWGFLALTTVVWCLRSTRRRAGWILAALTGYTTVTLGMGIYAPFIIPVVVVVAAFAVGAYCDRRFGDAVGWRRFRQVLPLLIAGIAALLVMLVWILTRFDTIRGFTETVYPGERLQSVGSADGNQFAQLLSGFLSFGLGYTHGQPFTVNESEASTFFLPGLFLVPVLIWLIVSRRRRGGGLDAIAIACLAALIVMFAFLFIPGWDALAHALFLDRTTYSRMRIGFGVLSMVMVVVCIWRLDGRRPTSGAKPPLAVSMLSAGLAAASILFVVWEAHELVGDGLWGAVAKRDIALGALFAAGLVVVVWLLARDRAAAAAGGLLVLSLAQSAVVNPVYSGVLDLRETESVKAVQAVDQSEPGNWVGIGNTLLPTMMLVESGVRTFNGVQGFPSEEMWDAIDPSGAHEEIWNRLATTSWVLGDGEPNPRNPAPDQIQMTFDPCSDFAQKHVRWVLSEVTLEGECVDLVETVDEGPTTMRIYGIAP
ncbi:hypothetical protein N3K63_00590 [Microbacterium sp. W1N]|uniref:DUF7657 domain-containing protein n=1 Tax=Microbacterium festucae TaxID=2977531 RepID=UPI0021C0EDF8|nr:hypothetical protein [Microbacterium festucae]MCT9818773.1 hypothetical protein [Microbacterium festucae]